MLAAAFVTMAQSPGEPWALTVEERIALRTNPDLARERVRGGRRIQASSSASVSTPLADAFDGRSHPELFLPHQVFDELIKLAYTGDVRTSQLVRDGLTPDVRQHGLPADFWERLRATSSVYVADVHAQRDLNASIRQQQGTARKRAQQALALKQRDACRSRATAFAAARAQFGRERFDRFLYEVIAVKMFSMADKLPDAALLRQAEEGCR